MTELIYREEVYHIIGICLEVYNRLGYGFREVVYKDAMEIEFHQREWDYQREKGYAVSYKGKNLGRIFYSDFLVFQKIIVEVKSNPDDIIEEYIAQTLNYLKASGIKLGVIINFGKKRLQYRRVIL